MEGSVTAERCTLTPLSILKDSQGLLLQVYLHKISRTYSSVIQAELRAQPALVGISQRIRVQECSSQVKAGACSSPTSISPHDYTQPTDLNSYYCSDIRSSSESNARILVNNAAP